MRDLFDRLAVKAGLTVPDKTQPLLPQTHPFDGLPIKSIKADLEKPLNVPENTAPMPHIAPQKAPAAAPLLSVEKAVHIHHHEQNIQTHRPAPSSAEPPKSSTKDQTDSEKQPRPQRPPRPQIITPVLSEPKTGEKEKVVPVTIEPAPITPVPLIPVPLAPTSSADKAPRTAAQRAAAAIPNRRAGQQNPSKTPDVNALTPIKISIGDIQVTAPSPKTSPVMRPAPKQQNISNLKDYLGWKGR